MRVFVIIVITFFLYLISLILFQIDLSIVNYGFWLIAGTLLGFRLCMYMYEKFLAAEELERSRRFNKRLKEEKRIN